LRGFRRDADNDQVNEGRGNGQEQTGDRRASVQDPVGPVSVKNPREQDEQACRGINDDLLVEGCARRPSFDAGADRSGENSGADEGDKIAKPEQDDAAFQRKALLPGRRMIPAAERVRKSRSSPRPSLET